MHHTRHDPYLLAKKSSLDPVAFSSPNTDISATAASFSQPPTTSDLTTMHSHSGSSSFGSMPSRSQPSNSPSGPASNWNRTDSSSSTHHRRSSSSALGPLTRLDGSANPSQPHAPFASLPASPSTQLADFAASPPDLQDEPKPVSRSHHAHSRSLGDAGSVMSRGDGVVPRALLVEAARQHKLGDKALSDKSRTAFADVWLLASYSFHEQATVSRQALYHSYTVTCERLDLRPMNAASFGKAFRGTFEDIQTRRLGVRGNSKYHYCGIQPRTMYEIGNLASFGDGPGGQHWVLPSNAPPRTTPLDNTTAPARSGKGTPGQRNDQVPGRSERWNEPSSWATSAGSDLRKPHSTGDLRDLAHHVPYARSSVVDPNSSLFPALSRRPSPLSFDGVSDMDSPMQQTPLSMSFSSPQAAYPVLRPSVASLAGYPTLWDAAGSLALGSAQGAMDVWLKFNGHLDSLVNAVRDLRFDLFEVELRSFWQQLSAVERDTCCAPLLAGLMVRGQAVAMNAMLEHLESLLLTPVPPTAVVAARHLGRNLETILVSSLNGYQPDFVKPRVELGTRFGHLLLRFFDLYNVASPLVSSLSAKDSLRRVSSSFDQVDFTSLRAQAALICTHRPTQIVSVLESLHLLLRSLADAPAPYAGLGSPWSDGGATDGAGAVRTLFGWTRATVDALVSGEANDAAELGRASSPRSILVNWSLITSQIVRDLALRSDSCLPTYQLLKVALDDVVSLKILRLVSLCPTSVAASVTSPVIPRAWSFPPPQSTTATTVDAYPCHFAAASTPRDPSRARSSSTASSSVSTTGSTFDPSLSSSSYTDYQPLSHSHSHPDLLSEGEMALDGEMAGLMQQETEEQGDLELWARGRTGGGQWGSEAGFGDEGGEMGMRWC